MQRWSDAVSSEMPEDGASNEDHLRSTFPPPLSPPPHSSLTDPETQAFYGEHWKDYPLEVQGVLEHLADLFPDGVEGRRVLDAGSGSGVVAIAFTLAGADVVGVDVSAGCIWNGRSNANRLGADVRFLEADLLTLDLGERFDIIYAWGVLHHTRDARTAFLRLASHLAPGGEMVVAVYLRTALSRFWNASRAVYRNAPGWLQQAACSGGALLLDGVDRVKRLLTGRSRYLMRGTRNEELIHDWFGVPHRTFHTYDEVFGWCREAGLEPTLWNEATGRFRSTSNFVVRARAPESEDETVH